MENTLKGKKKYEVTKRPDGSVEITAKGGRYGAHNIGVGARSGCILTVLVFLFGGGLIFQLLTAVGVPSEPALVPPFVLAIAFFAWFLKLKTAVVVKPGEGLIVGKNQIPVSDIDKIAVETWAADFGRGGTTSGRAYVESSGQRVWLSPNLDQAQARKIIEEVTSALGP